jgi:flotillin
MAKAQAYEGEREPPSLGNERSYVTASATRELGDWRTGRPVEDPGKTKRWGLVTAKPSEFLVHGRRGRVLHRTSGQGASCFKWPWDSVAVVPTSLQRLHFVADQITLERVGVAIAGLAVYRIAEPLLAYRVLNFSYPERAQQKLAQIVTDMLIGATRRLVANLTVDECLQKRKAALAEELLREIAPILGGDGRPDDATDRGWGVVLDTVEIQEVKILSEKVFTHLQAPYRAALARRAREASAEAEKVSALIEAASRRDVEQAQLDAEADIRARRAEIERREAERATDDALATLALERREEDARAQDAIARKELALTVERARVADARDRQVLAAEQAHAEIEAHEPKQRARALAAELERAQWRAALERRKEEAELEVAIAERRAEVGLAQARAENELAAAKARVITAERLPELAGAIGQRFGEVKVTQIGGDGRPFASITEALSSVLELARSAR